MSTDLTPFEGVAAQIGPEAATPILLFKPRL